MGHVQHTHLRRDPGDHPVTRGYEPVCIAVIGAQGDPVEGRHDIECAIPGAGERPATRAAAIRRRSSPGGILLGTRLPTPAAEAQTARSARSAVRSMAHPNGQSVSEYRTYVLYCLMSGAAFPAVDPGAVDPAGRRLHAPTVWEEVARWLVGASRLRCSGCRLRPR